MEIQIETEITPETLDKVFRLYDENFSPHVKIPHHKIKKRIDRNVYQLLSIQNENKEWIGFSLISFNRSIKTIFVDYLCIDKKFQKGGNGKRILQMINNKNIYPEYDFSILECENYLVGYYEKNNYKRIPLNYPILNSKPLFMLYRQRNSERSNEPDNTLSMIQMYHKFINYGLLFNGEIIICFTLLMIWMKMLLLLQNNNTVKIILNFKSTHT